MPLFFCKKKNKLESHKKVCENKNVFNVMMPSEDTKILEFNQYKKSDEPSFIIYADLKCLIDSKILEFNQYKNLTNQHSLFM